LGGFLFRKIDLPNLLELSHQSLEHHLRGKKGGREGVCRRGERDSKGFASHSREGFETHKSPRRQEERELWEMKL